MSEPTKLTREQLLPLILPLVVATEYRGVATQAGRSAHSPPPPCCPSCDQPSTGLAVQSDYSFQFDLIHFIFQPCGHALTADGDDVVEVYSQARHIAASNVPNSKESSA